MNMNKSEKCPNTIGTINLPPQFNRPQQGLLYALHTTKRKSKQQAGAKQHFQSLLCYVVHEAWRSSQHLCRRAVSLSSPENNGPQNTLEHQELQWVLGENHAEERNGHKPEKKKLRKTFGTFTQLLCLPSAANRLIPIAHRFLHTPNTAETFTDLQVAHTRCANHQTWTNNIETHKNHLPALWTILRRMAFETPPNTTHHRSLKAPTHF